MAREIQLRRYKPPPLDYFFCPLIIKSLFKNCIFYLLVLSLTDIYTCLMSDTCKCDKHAKNKKSGRQTLFQTTVYVLTSSLKQLGSVYVTGKCCGVGTCAAIMLLLSAVVAKSCLTVHATDECTDTDNISAEAIRSD